MVIKKEATCLMSKQERMTGGNCCSTHKSTCVLKCGLEESHAKRASSPACIHGFHSFMYSPIPIMQERAKELYVNSTLTLCVWLWWESLWFGKVVKEISLLVQLLGPSIPTEDNNWGNKKLVGFGRKRTEPSSTMHGWEEGANTGWDHWDAIVSWLSTLVRQCCNYLSIGLVNPIECCLIPRVGVQWHVWSWETP